MTSNSFLKSFMSKRKNGRGHAPVKREVKIKYKTSEGYKEKEDILSKKIVKKNEQHFAKDISIDKKTQYVKYFLNRIRSIQEEKPNHMNKKIIACVLRRSKDYDVDYVNHLIQSLKMYVNVDVEYVCISDVDVSDICTWIQFENDWPGWWSKLELFSHPYLKGKDVVYFDLDVIVKDDITDFISKKHNFSMLRGLSKDGIANSSIMAWSKDRSYISKQFNPDIHIVEYKQKNKWGDQDFTRIHVNDEISFIQDHFPYMVASKKYSSKEEISSSKIVCFHGKPRPREVGWKF